MKPLLRLFQPLQTAAAAFFKHDVTLKRKEGAVHLVLEKRPAEPRKPLSRQELAARKDQDELALIRGELAELLDELPGTRQTMRHLAFVEQALGKKGLRALHKLPLDVLQKALEQIEGLVTNWSRVGLANLRSKIAVAILDREHGDPTEAEADAYRTSAVLDREEGATRIQAEAAEAETQSEDEALAAAYAALGALAATAEPEPSGPADLPPLEYEVEVQGQLGSAATKAASREAARGSVSGSKDTIKLRELAE